MNTHLVGVFPAALAALTVVGVTWRTPALSREIRKLAQIVGVLLLSQIALGIATLRLHLQVELLTVSHQAIGAALFGTLVCFTVLAWRDRAFAPEES